MYSHPRTHTHPHTYKQKHAHKHSHLLARGMAHTRTHVHTHTHLRVRAHANTHIHKQTHVATSLRNNSSTLEFSVLQCVAVCCSVLQCNAVCCSVMQCAAVCCRTDTHMLKRGNEFAEHPFTLELSVLQCVAACCSMLLCVAGKTHTCSHVAMSLRNTSSTLELNLALLSIKGTPHSSANLCPSSAPTSRSCTKSFLLPTNTYCVYACKRERGREQHAATRCNTLQHTVTHCNTLLHTPTLPTPVTYV